LVRPSTPASNVLAVASLLPVKDSSYGVSVAPSLSATTNGLPFFKLTGSSAAPNATGTTYVVNVLDDHDDGACDAADCTLREALNAANANAGADTLTFAPTMAGAILLTLGQLSITSDLTIDGPGANILAVSGAGANRV